MKRNPSRKLEKEIDRRAEKTVRGSVAGWGESLRVNAGEEAESDEIQEIVRHHRKDLSDQFHEEKIPKKTPPTKKRAA